MTKSPTSTFTEILFSPKNLASRLAIAGLIFTAVGALNAKLVFDDVLVIDLYRQMVSHYGFLENLRRLFFIVDLRGEYRVYGFSKVLHFIVWNFAGTHAWMYGTIISAAQFATALGIYRILRNFRTATFQASCCAAAWILSPLAVTSVFHYYSYILLPYQVTVACALVLQRLQESGRPTLRLRALLAFLAIALGATGEAHLPVASLILTFVALAGPSPRTWFSRTGDLLIVFFTTAITIVSHRWIWSVLTAEFRVTNRRFAFAIPDAQAGSEATKVFCKSLLLGISSQLGPILLLAGPWVIVTGAFVIQSAIVWRFTGRGERKIESVEMGKGLYLPGALAILCALSVATYCALAVLSNQVNHVFPRRYGYVPYTLALMALVTLLAAPATRRKLGTAPALAGMGVLGWFWLTLVAVCLPMVRLQDAKVWNAVFIQLTKHPSGSVLFVSSPNHFNQPGFVYNPSATAGLRGEGFPDIFESPFSYAVWESQYATVILGARVVGVRFDRVNSTSVLVTGDQSPTIVPSDSLIVVTDLALRASDFPRTRNRLKVLNWHDFQLTAAAHNGVRVVTGWDQLLGAAPGGLEISLGRSEAGVRGVLPDKRFFDSQVGQGVIADYGVEEGTGAPYGADLAGPLSYFLSNRYGSYAYRIDFSDHQPKVVSLDMLERFHDKAGSRSIDIDAAFDDEWFPVAKAFDPAAWALNVPVTLKLYPGSARTFRVRLTSAPGATDVPFLNGIRVEPIPK